MTEQDIKKLVTWIAENAPGLLDKISELSGVSKEQIVVWVDAVVDRKVAALKGMKR